MGVWFRGIYTVKGFDVMDLKLKRISKFNGSIDDLKCKFDDFIERNPNTNKFLNTKASLYWIVRGSLSYFDELDSKFLGDNNDNGIPNESADHFVNTFYRLSNSLDYLFKMWHKQDSFKHSDNWNILSDIRTLIVHSGEQITNLNSFKSIGFKNYKDAQLGRLLNTKGDSGKFVRLLYSDSSKFDYLIRCWTDKHDLSKSRRENDLNYDNDHENFDEIVILINAKDVRDVVLSEVEQFLNHESGKPVPTKKSKVLPKEVKKQVVRNCDFDKLENLISKRSRGGYFIDDGSYWDGFGLKRIMDYVSSKKISVSDTVKNKIESVICTKLAEFCTSYNDPALNDFDVTSLDFRDVFKDYLPTYELKSYLEGEKLFSNIAPDFNCKDRNDLVDVDYLLKFIRCVQNALGQSLNLEGTVDDLICEYVVKSVEKSLGNSDSLSKGSL